MKIIWNKFKKNLEVRKKHQPERYRLNVMPRARSGTSPAAGQRGSYPRLGFGRGTPCTGTPAATPRCRQARKETVPMPSAFCAQCCCAVVGSLCCWRWHTDTSWRGTVGLCACATGVFCWGQRHGGHRVCTQPQSVRDRCREKAAHCFMPVHSINDPFGACATLSPIAV